MLRGFRDSHGLMFFEKVLGGLTVVVKSPCYDASKTKWGVKVSNEIFQSKNHTLL
jgi:hypothetical protein